MRAVGLKELKNRLSEYVRIAAAGERVLVTDRDRVVAELVAPQPGRRPRLRTPCWRRRSVPVGCDRPCWLPTGTIPRRQPVAPLAELRAELEEDRADR